MGAGELEAVREKLADYKRFRELTKEWVDLAIERERLEPSAAKKAGR